MPAVTFCKGISPLKRRERFHEFTVLIASPHQARFLVEKVLVIHCTFGIKIHLLFRTLKFFRQFVNAPVIIGILQCTCCIFIYLYIVRDISEFVVIFISQTSCRRYFRMNIVSSMNKPLIKSFQVFNLYSLHICINQYRSRIVSYHTTSVSWTCPFWEETAFFICINQTFLNFFIDRRIHHVKQWEQTSESIPEACICVHISRQDFTVVRTIVNNLTIFIYLIELSWEKQRTVQA